MPVSVIVHAAKIKREIEYEEFARAMTVSCAPSMSAKDRKAVLRKAKPQDSPVMQKVIEYNPEKAKKFFRAMGARVDE